MDQQTLAAYRDNAGGLAVGQTAHKPGRTGDLVRAFFHAGAETADIGCGAGRYTSWLVENGFPVVGYDASPEMLAEARAIYPDLCFCQTALPELQDIGDGAFANVLCSAVLMHLPAEELITAVLALGRILRPDGRLLLSWRDSRSACEREPDGRLYTSIPRGKLILLLESAGFQVVEGSEEEDAVRAGVRWHVIVAEKSAAPAARGLDRVQAILAQDRKVATYKLALVRALCAISRAEDRLVVWRDGAVYVPVLPIAVHWLAYYWPIFAQDHFLAQIRGERAGCEKPIAFRAGISQLVEEFKPAGLYCVLRAIESDPQLHMPLLKKIAHAIKEGPVTFAGTEAAPVFGKAARIDTQTSQQAAAGMLGWVRVPEPVWLDICRFDHWIEDSVVVRWARLSAEMNPKLTAAHFLPLLIADAADKRATSEARAVLLTRPGPLECTWTGRSVGDKFDVDHVIPFSVWGSNDLWNLLPCAPAVNGKKSDRLPSLALLKRREEAIVDHWRFYHDAVDGRFDAQMLRALGTAPGRNGWERVALSGLQEILVKLRTTRGLRDWDPAIDRTSPADHRTGGLRPGG